MRSKFALALALVGVVGGCVTPLGNPGRSNPGTAPGEQGAPTFAAVRVVAGGWEPAIAVGPGNLQWVGTQGPARNAPSGPAQVYVSADGGLHWNKTPTDPPVPGAGADNEIKVTPSGRVLSAMLGSGGAGPGPVIDIRYSDDAGKTWTLSQGVSKEDQDRPWLAVGAKDPNTGQYDVYLLWHNLFSGAANHEMFVQTSRDGGANFGTPIPIALPGSQAYSDLQCADSGGPSVIFTNPSSGQVYAVFGTRSSAAGGCGASVTGSFEINVVASTRAWVATSKDQGQTWTDSLAVDDNANGQMIGLQEQEGMVDSAGNVVLVYAESPKPYPNYEDAGIKFVWAPADLGQWSKPIELVPEGTGSDVGAGVILPQMAVGQPGHLAAWYLAGTGQGNESLWYPTIAETFDGLAASPHVTVSKISDIPAWKGSASSLMGVCQPAGSNAGPVNAALAGFTCPRSSDVYGQALTATCWPAFVWYDGEAAARDGNGTYVGEQTGGQSLCA